jgi:hypothetical protein
MNAHLMVVLSNVEDGQEDEFNKWYTDEHIVDVVEKLPGFVTAQRYELASSQLEPTEYRYLTIYTIPAERLAEAQASILFSRKEREQAQREGRRAMLTVSTAMAAPHVSWFYSPVTDVVRAEHEPASLE